MVYMYVNVSSNTLLQCQTNNTDSTIDNNRLTVFPVSSCSLGVQDKNVCCDAVVNRQPQSPLIDERDLTINY